MLSMYLANPALAGGAAGGILFGLLTVYELDRAGRSRVEVLTNAVVSPLAAALVRLPALLAAAGLALVLTMLVWLPISCGLIGSIFDGGDYVPAYLLFMGLALPLSILAASAAYQYTRRADLSLVLFAAFAALSLTVWADNWQLCWLNPCVWALSDDFSNFRIFRSVAWMRLTWLAALAGSGRCRISASGSTERAARLPWPGACGGPTGLSSPCRFWPVPALPMPPSPWWTTATPTRRLWTSTRFPMRRMWSVPAAAPRYSRTPPLGRSPARRPTGSGTPPGRRGQRPSASIRAIPSPTCGSTAPKCPSL